MTALADLLALTSDLTQSNSAALVLYSHFAVPKFASGVAMALLLWLVVVGGIKRIAVSAERLVPAMTIAYLASAFIVLAFHWQQIPAAIALIVTNAFPETTGPGPLVALLPPYVYEGDADDVRARLQSASAKGKSFGRDLRRPQARPRCRQLRAPARRRRRLHYPRI